MNNHRRILLSRAVLTLALALPLQARAQAPAAAPAPGPQELPIRIVPNLGEAAEFYFSPDGKSLIGNAKREGDTTHHVYTTTIDGTKVVKINDKGEDACSFFFPDGKHLLWTSTRDLTELPKGNWSDPKQYPKGAELYQSDLEGKNVKRLTNNMQYDAEAAVSPDGKWILFGRDTDGKMDLWVMKADGTEPKQITFTEEWQEGGAQFMPDSNTILTRAWKRADEGQRMMPMQIFTVKRDGSDRKQITSEAGTNWAPFPAPDGKHFAYVKVLTDTPRPNWEIFMMNIETGKQTRLTNNPGFDGFPAISPDGKLLAFSSGRDAKPGERTLYEYVMDISSLGIVPVKK
jgi:Tol biopolymer transport system component